MPEDKVDVVEATPSTEVDANSSIEDIMEYASKMEDTEATEESSPSEQEQVEPGDGDKAQDSDKGTEEKTEEGKEPEEDIATTEETEGKIPYDRFKEVNDKYRETEQERDKLKADLEDARKALRNPKVLETIMKDRGYTEDRIQEYMKENGIDPSVKSEQDFDLDVREDWIKLIDHKIQQGVRNALEPVQTTLSEYQQQQETAKQEAWLAEETEKASKLAKDTFDLEYGQVGKDERNANTAVGKMYSYVQKHPEDAKLGYTKILRLALSEEGYKKGIEKGKKAEKARQQAVKSAAMESAGTITTDAEPNWGEMSTSEIFEYASQMK